MASFVPLIPMPPQFQDGNGDPFNAAVLGFFLSGTTTATPLFSDNTGTSIGTSITLNSSGYPESGGNVITLFRDSAIAIKLMLFTNAAAFATLTDPIWTADTLEDGLVILASTSNAKGASLIGIEDSAALFTAAQVEAALAELAVNWFKNNRANTISNVMTFSGIGEIRMVDLLVRRPLLIDYGIKHGFVASVSNVTTLDMTTGNSFRLTLIENTTIVLDNPSPNGVMCEIIVRIHQDSGGGAYTVTWPATVKWPSGVAPVITTTNSAIDRITLTTDDEGTFWYGDYSQAYSF